MPIPWGGGRDRSAGPNPFTSQWINEPPAPPRPRRFGTSVLQAPPSVPVWLPSERTMTAVLVLLLVCATAIVAGPENGGSSLRIAASSDGTPTAELAQNVGGVSTEPRPDGSDAD